MPGVISGLASILMVVVASEDLYGPRFVKGYLNNEMTISYDYLWMEIGSSLSYFSFCRSLYLIYPRCAPNLGSEDLERLQALVPKIAEGEGRTVEMQALYQLIGLVLTISTALICGAMTGIKIVLLNFGQNNYLLKVL